ncbi:centromere kinetochore component CENP-T-domain-containing protein [Aspergillus pseudotamarii]|uniref:Centromere kinetochore component CENP-T-domain-containing protein n=1 Tax=Aspergillus pseudotamarii TaxID=132259 RepID=A0A5N6SY64_ASPPS|nr:centromere kinetochore component CENP-T-domain-containing protein [Aspergillus pseudotamarii]KAE8139636.1 centromere kinetochore component CENP-T-domain-containing protein [Aspergillus pseudotamarii]
MSTTPKPRGRRSSRGSDMSETFTPVGDTTLTGLQRLPIHTRYPLTPSRLAVSGTPSRRTPRNRATAAPSTPYGLRAIQRRAANTPARDRRKSGRMQRETTFDILRNLGRALAPVSQPIRSSPQEEKPEPELEPEKDEIEELDNEPEIERPRLSLPLEDVEEQEEASPEPRPPRLSLAFEEEDITVEYPRRATSEHDRARLSMMSFGNPRLSENFGDATRLESDSEDGDDTGIEHGDDGENQDETVMSQGAFDRGGETEDLGRFNFDFNFPSPPPPPADDIDGPLNDDEGFELPPVDLAQDTAPMSDDSDYAAVTAGEFGLDLHMQSRVSLSESPGIVGGGLREEDTVIVQGKQKKLSRHGILVPNMPSGVIRKLATRFAPARAGSKAKISKATLAAIEQASSWYFEQVAEDLAAYSKHAGRKTIDESDVIALMRRQRHINNSTTAFSLASKHLPKELLQDMRLSMPP